jgi:hypothetical protein
MVGSSKCSSVRGQEANQIFHRMGLRRIGNGTSPDGPRRFRCKKKGSASTGWEKRLRQRVSKKQKPVSDTANASLTPLHGLSN